jgi:hypothetical protein
VDCDVAEAITTQCVGETVGWGEAICWETAPRQLLDPYWRSGGMLISLYPITRSTPLNIAVCTVRGSTASHPAQQYVPYGMTISRAVNQQEFSGNIPECNTGGSQRIFRTFRGWRMASSGMLRRVALVRTEVSEELSASFIRVTRICGTFPQRTSVASYSQRCS